MTAVYHAQPFALEISRACGLRADARAVHEALQGNTIGPRDSELLEATHEAFQFGNHSQHAARGGARRWADLVLLVTRYGRAAQGL